MDIAIAKMSSKGQIVIPSELRKGISEGDKLVLIRQGKQILMKKATETDKNFKEDMEFAKRTEASWKQIEAGEYKQSSADEFLKKLKGW